MRAVSKQGLPEARPRAKKSESLILVPSVGLEPTANCLRGNCSTIEL